jgi:hypothetical protein
VPGAAHKYQQPRRINAVSISVLVLLAAACYTVFSAWPVAMLHTDVKAVLDDALPRLYRANLLPEPESANGVDQIRQELVEKLTALGIAEPDAALSITRDTRIVAITAKIVTAIHLKLIHRSIPLTLHPRVETSAERVVY